MTKLKILIILVSLLAMGALLLTQNQAQFKLRQENEALKQQVQQAEQLAAENERLSNEVAQAKSSLPKEQMDELLKQYEVTYVLLERNRSPEFPQNELALRLQFPVVYESSTFALLQVRQ